MRRKMCNRIYLGPLLVSIVLSELAGAQAAGQDDPQPIKAARIKADKVRDKPGDPREAPRPEVSPKERKNLFGDTIGPANRFRKDAESLYLDRGKTVIDKLIELSNDYEKVTKEISGLRTKLESKQKEYKLLPGEVAKTQLELIDVQNRIDKLGVVNEARGNRIRANQQPMRQLKQQEYNLRGILNGMKIKAQGLPPEVRRLANQEIPLRETEQKKIAAAGLRGFLIQADLCSVTELVTEADAKALAQVTEVSLIGNPEQTLIRMLSGFAQLKLSQFDRAIKELDQVQQELLAHPMANLMEVKQARCQALVGLAWAHIHNDRLKEAGKALGKTKSLSRSARPRTKYELKLCDALRLQRLGKNSQSFKLYQRTIKIYPDWPDAYRMVARLAVIKSPEIALENARKACELDRSDDWRNRIALAEAQWASDDRNGFDATTKGLLKQTDQQARKKIEQAIQKIQQ